jgi:hypothetical protein
MPSREKYRGPRTVLGYGSASDPIILNDAEPENIESRNLASFSQNGGHTSWTAPRSNTVSGFTNGKGSSFTSGASRQQHAPSPISTHSMRINVDDHRDKPSDVASAPSSDKSGRPRHVSIAEDAAEKARRSKERNAKRQREWRLRQRLGLGQHVSRSEPQLLPYEQLVQLNGDRTPCKATESQPNRCIKGSSGVANANGQRPDNSYLQPVDQLTLQNVLQVPQRTTRDDASSIASTSASRASKICRMCRHEGTLVRPLTKCNDCHRHYHNVCGTPSPDSVTGAFRCGKCIRQDLKRVSGAHTAASQSSPLAEADTTSCIPELTTQARQEGISASDGRGDGTRSAGSHAAPTDTEIDMALEEAMSDIIPHTVPERQGATLDEGSTDTAAEAAAVEKMSQLINNVRLRSDDDVESERPRKRPRLGASSAVIDLSSANNSADERASETTGLTTPEPIISTTKTSARDIPASLDSENIGKPSVDLQSSDIGQTLPASESELQDPRTLVTTIHESESYSDVPGTRCAASFRDGSPARSRISEEYGHLRLRYQSQSTQTDKIQQASVAAQTATDLPLDDYGAMAEAVGDTLLKVTTTGMNELDPDHGSMIVKLRSKGVMFEDESSDDEMDEVGDISWTPPSSILGIKSSSKNLFDVAPALFVSSTEETPESRFVDVETGLRVTKKHIDLLSCQLQDRRRRSGADRIHRTADYGANPTTLTTVVYDSRNAKWISSRMSLGEYMGLPQNPVYVLENSKLAFGEGQAEENLQRNETRRAKLQRWRFME